MEPRIPLRLLLATSIVAAMAFVFASGAMAWTVDHNTTLPFSVHVNDNTIPPGLSGVLCPTATNDPEPTNTCGHFRFVAGDTGPLTIRYTLSDPTQVVSVYVCEENTAPTVPSLNCPSGETEVVCDSSMGTPDPTDPTYQIITCNIPNPGVYELLIVPNAVFTCTETDELTGACLGETPGITVSGTLSMTGLNPIPDPVTNEDGKAKGGGKLGPGESFMLKAYGDPKKLQHSMVHFLSQTQGCYFHSTSISSVAFTFNLLGLAPGGTVTINGSGYVYQRQHSPRGSWYGSYTRTQVSFTAKATDSGSDHGAGDTFQLTAPGCSNTQQTLSSGDIKIGTHDDGRDDREDD